MNASDEKIDKSQNTVQIGEKQLAVNKKGYLINFDDWDEDFARTMSEKDHLKLTDCHWEAINFLRKYDRILLAKFHNLFLLTI